MGSNPDIVANEDKYLKKIKCAFITLSKDNLIKIKDCLSKNNFFLLSLSDNLHIIKVN